MLGAIPARVSVMCAESFVPESELMPGLARCRMITDDTGPGVTLDEAVPGSSCTTGGFDE
ncbi:MAG: hypothetical protein CL790_01160 [Chloroflexi bacterium]|nr:hypothetical protein [Chloroflexota bacterium]HCU72310.1 hypothetical protein [Chloroflexota bacterium]